MTVSTGPGPRKGLFCKKGKNVKRCRHNILQYLNGQRLQLKVLQTSRGRARSKEQSTLVKRSTGDLSKLRLVQGEAPAGIRRANRTATAANPCKTSQRRVADIVQSQRSKCSMWHNASYHFSSPCNPRENVTSFIILNAIANVKNV